MRYAPNAIEKPDVQFSQSVQECIVFNRLELSSSEKQMLFHLKNPLEGYRRLTFMMLDADIVAVSPASVRRLLSRAGLLRKWKGKPSKRGTGFDQPPQPH